MFNQMTDTSGRRYVQPTVFKFNPTPSSGVMGVWLSEDEDVDWSIMTNPDGSQHCFGYTIKKKGVPMYDKEIQVTPFQGT